MLKIEFGFGVCYRGDGQAILGHEQIAGIADICRRATTLFGGHTILTTFGEWWDEEADSLVAEEGRTLFVLADSTHPNTDERVVNLAEQIRESLKQKAVCVTFTEVKFLILN